MNVNVHNSNVGGAITAMETDAPRFMLAPANTAKANT